MTRKENNNAAELMVSDAFPDAERMWFWFLSSRRIKNGIRAAGGDWGRPCELLDIETMVTRLFLSGRLSARELEVLKKYGDLRRCPNQHVWGENRDASLWNSAMRTIGIEARGRGWVA